MMTATAPRLNALLAGLALPSQTGLDIVLSDLVLDSREVSPGSLFVAIPGRQSDGRNFIDQALQRGARAVLVESVAAQETRWRGDVPLVPVEHLAANLGQLASQFFGDPSRLMWIAGITGTNGKTSIAWWMQQLLAACGLASASLGTLGIARGSDIRELPGGLTTGDAVSLQRQLAKLHEEGIEALAMEVSSHALDQHRVSRVSFDVAIFTNLSQDHLDYHADMAAYGAAKRRLFDMPDLAHALINTDDAFGRQLASDLQPGIEVLTYGVVAGDADIRVADRIDQPGITARVATPWGELDLINPHIVGDFNLANLLAVVGAAGIKGLDLSAISAAVTQLGPVPGRLQAVASAADDIRVLVDFAHTPDAIAQVLQAVARQKSGRMHCVLGAGGDRDRSKRPQMTAAACRHADSLVLTSDNPRSEDPVRIIDDMAAGLPADFVAHRIADRAEAISRAITAAAPGDVVVILGKGHERYQQIGNQRLPFSDQDIAEQALARRRSGRS